MKIKKPTEDLQKCIKRFKELTTEYIAANETTNYNQTTIDNIKRTRSMYAIMIAEIVSETVKED